MVLVGAMVRALGDYPRRVMHNRRSLQLVQIYSVAVSEDEVKRVAGVLEYVVNDHIKSARRLVHL